MSLLPVLVTAWVLVLLVPVLAVRLGPRTGWVAAAVLGALTVVVAAGPASSPEPVDEVLPWIPALEVMLRLRMDGLGALFALVVLGIGAVIMAYSTSYLTGRGSGGFYALMTAFAAAMLTLVLADDLVLLFVAWEITTVCSYLLILRVGPKGRQPAARTLLITVFGGLALLGAVCTIVVRTGTTQLSVALADPAWGTDPVFAGVVAVLVAVAAMTKAAQFPFHSWLPDAMVAPAPVSAYLHAAAMVKAGIYLLMRFSGAAAAAPVWPWLLVTVGVVTSLLGGVFALQRHDLKELLAYSTVSQLGLLVAVIGIGTPTALLAASAHVVAHALFKSAGFMTVGLLERRAGTRDLRELRGLFRAMPWTATMIVLAAAGMAGIPVTLGFVSKEYVLDAALSAGTGPGTLAAVGLGLAAVLTVAYSARMVVPIMFGSAAVLRPAAGARAMAGTVTVTALAGAVLGPAAGVLDPLLTSSAAASLRIPPAGVDGFYVWHGLAPALLVSVLAVATGVGLVLARARVDRLLDRPLWPFTGVAAVQRLRAGIIDLGRTTGRPTAGDAPARHLLVPILLIAVGGTAAVALRAGDIAAAPDTSRTTDVLLLLLSAAGIGAVLIARDRLTAVLAAGVVGFSVALWFFGLGAADVALTQLLVEVLTVAVIVLILRRLPRGFPRARGRDRRAVPRVVLAVGAGVAATTATLLMTGWRAPSAASVWFLAEAEGQTGGSNVVNTILVDFRALDTFGELVVLALAALVMTALLDARRSQPLQVPARPAAPVVDPRANAIFLRTAAKVLVPFLLLASVYVLLRGHNAPGGGFIGALVGASALVLAYLAAPSDTTGRVRLPFLLVAGMGAVVAAATGLLGLLDGSFLRPLHADVLGVHLSTALVFDVGVYLAVLGVVVAGLNLLGSPPADEPDPDPPTERSAQDHASEEASRWSSP
ncbi:MULTISPECIES: hydrogen gas-evolving membrane-bound hydrogenase subunit E [Pseudonocardia]|uniref:Na(+)/H(+) antiporter subunit A n=2 Tax=Pseudonocardia TaxID=1847 RepID=A0A1Y2N3Y2_PSEAH|nr:MULTISPECIES: hydrogen gas-evolving membrane-bound hydrogenase subunit E [Pseudonocardia]OSY42175.1 Na(+)/H(+) antiporter subunit A [Pseudonocardia autotrophica]TDN75057.1 multisubunit sodium/proton antiporter MrpA subunit /multisubunit sodium/proton antiporter MrpB subunit [Pseudonocardia autotrophica]BBF99001.1 putative cation antiporter NADH dehydrogenase subunit [Pseudonocardia autotrophica]GEC23921.1 putative cation antiporter NADH dehydrogenase subunit [Pseudonocardia saturnea]